MDVPDQYEDSAGVKVDDIAKRLMDYGFHAPTMSWPVPGTLMIEPTESESLANWIAFCDAMIAIREEIKAIEEGKSDRADNALERCTAHRGGRHQRWLGRTAIHASRRRIRPLTCVHSNSGRALDRVDNPFGDRNLVCTCPPMSEYGS